MTNQSLQSQQFPTNLTIKRRRTSTNQKLPRQSRTTNGKAAQGTYNIYKLGITSLCDDGRDRRRNVVCLFNGLFLIRMILRQSRNS